MANYNDLAWVLDEPQRELLLRQTPTAFDDDRGAWGLCLAQADALKKDAANTRLHAAEAAKAFEEQLKAAPEDPGTHAYLGLSLAYLGRKEEAIRVLRDGLLYGKNELIAMELERIGWRKIPAFPSLGREHPVNRILGKLTKSLGIR